MFEFITILVLCLALFLGGFYYGFKIAQDIYLTKDLHSESLPVVKSANAIKTAVHTETEEERQLRILTENIENFGTNIPQKEVR